MLRHIPLLLIVVTLQSPAVVVDRIVATVGRTVITDSMVRRAIRASAFLGSQPLDESRTQWEQARERLIEQQLIREEIRVSRYPVAQPDEIRAAMDQVREQIGTPEQFALVLKDYHLTERDLSENVASQLTFSRFLAYRFRPAVQVSDEALRKFYETWQPSEGSKPSFEEARDRVETQYIIAEANRLLDQWLRDARQQTRIETYEPEAAR